jgi:hypothetical protein
VPNLDFAHVKSWLRRAFPVGSSSVSPKLLIDIHPLNTVINGFSNDDAYNRRTCQNTVQKVHDQRDLDTGFPTIFDDTDFTHFFGLVYDGGNPVTHYLAGCSDIPSPDSPDDFFKAVGTGATGPIGKGEVPWFDTTGVRWDRDGSYGDWYTGHELGHTLGRLHIKSNSAPCRMPDDYLDTDDATYPDHRYSNGQLSDSPGPPYFVGFDTGDPTLGLNASGNPLSPMQVLPGAVWHDMMTYCIKQWISDQTYTDIYRRLVKENQQEEHLGLFAYTPEDSQSLNRLLAQIRDDIPLPYAELQPTSHDFSRTDRGRPRALQVGSQQALQQYSESSVKKFTAKFLHGDLIVVRATVNLTNGTGSFSKIIRVSRARVSARPQDDKVRIRITYPNGKITEQPVNVMLMTESYKGERTGTVSAVLPYASGKVVLGLFMDNKLVDTLRASQNAPKLGKIHPPQLVGTTGLRFTWDKAKDADKNVVTYSVQMRFMNEDPWRTVGLDLQEPNLSLSSERFKGFRSVQLRVIASDGYHSTAKTSIAFPLHLPLLTKNS